MNKKIKLSLSTILLTTIAVSTPIIVVCSNQSTPKVRVPQIAKSIWNPTTIVDQNKSLNDKNFQSKLKQFADYGNYTPWKTVVLKGEGGISAICPNSAGNFWVSNSYGSISTLNNQGEDIGITISELVGNSRINSIVTDSHGGFYVAGDKGLIDHVNKDGSIDEQWRKQVFLNGQKINVLLADYAGGIYLAGDEGLFDHIDKNGQSMLKAGMQVLIDGAGVNSMIYGAKGDLVIGGQQGAMARVDFQGNHLIDTQKLLSGSDILAIVPIETSSYMVIGQSSELNIIDETGTISAQEKPLGNTLIQSITPNGNGNFLIGNNKGRLTLVDKAGKVVSGFKTRELVNGSSITNIISDGLSGFFITSDHGEIDHLDKNGLLFGFNSWIVYNHEQTTRYEQYRDLLTSEPKSQSILDYSNVKVLHQIAGGGFLAAGTGGQLGLFNSDGSQSSNWKTTKFLEGKDISTIADGPENKFYIAGANRIIEEVDANGQITNQFASPFETDVYQMINDGQNGFILIGGNGSFAHVDKDFNIIDASNLQGNYAAITPDGLGNYFVGGGNGQLLHVDAKGEVIPNWKIPNLIEYQTINVIVSDGNGNLLIGGTGGLFAKVNYNGDVIDSEQKVFLNGERVLDIIPDGEGNLLFVGDNKLVERMVPGGGMNGVDLSFFDGGNITQITSDDQGGFWIAGDGGKLAHFILDADGNILKPESQEETFARWAKQIKTTLSADFTDKSFAFSGSNGKGTILYLPQTLNENLELEYSTDDGKTWTETTPMNLTNGDMVKVRLVVKEDFADWFDVAQKNELDLKVDGLSQKQVLNTQLDVSKFSFSGTSTQSSAVNYSGDLTHLEILYSVDNGITWTSTFPNNLKNDDTIKAKLNILAADADHYELDPAVADPVDLLVTGLSKVTLTDKLTETEFSFNGTSGNGTIVFTPSQGFSPLLTVEYQVNNEAWTKTIPTSIHTKDSLAVRLALKCNNGGVYDYDSTTLSITNHVPKNTLSDSIFSRDFFFSGTTGNGTITFDPSIPLSDKLEIQYTKNYSPSSLTPPIDLKTGDNLTAALKVKDEFKDDYEIYSYSNTSVNWNVKLDKIALHDVISENDFHFKGGAYSGTVEFNPTKPLATQLEVQYSYQNGPWTTTIPTNLSNNDSPLLARLAVKGSDVENYRLEPANRENTVLSFGLNKVLINNPIKESDFIFSGTAGDAKMQFNPSSLQHLPISVDYSVDGTTWQPIDFGVQVDIKIMNGDEIYARPRLNNDEINYELSPSAKLGIIMQVNNLNKIVLQDKITDQDFVFSGNDKEGTVSLNSDRIISPHLEVQYSQDAGNSWNNFAPVNLSNDDIIKARLSLKTPSDNYSIASNSTDLKVKNLPFKIQLHDKITADDFVFSGYNGKAQIGLSPNLYLPEQLAVEYSSDEVAWNANPPVKLFSNGDSVFAKLVLKNKDANGNPIDHSQNYEIVNGESVKITASDLREEPKRSATIQTWGWALVGLGVAVALASAGIGLFFLIRHKRK